MTVIRPVPEKLSVMNRCPLYSMSAMYRFDCSCHTDDKNHNALGYKVIAWLMKTPVIIPIIHPHGFLVDISRDPIKYFMLLCILATRIN